jgi:cytochrome c biogenesis factor
VLKSIARQISGQTDINAAQVRLAVLQNNSTQTLATQLAAANLSHSANEARAMAKARLYLLKETTDMKAEIRAMRLKFTDDFD